MELNDLVHKRIAVQSSENRDLDMYCHCNKKMGSSVAMIECDACGNWFHSSCIGLTDDQIPTIAQYFCQRCFEWGDIKTQVLGDYKVRVNQ